MLRSGREGIVNEAEDYDEVSLAISDSLSDTAKLRKDEDSAPPMTTGAPVTTSTEKFEPLVVFENQSRKSISPLGNTDDMFVFNATTTTAKSTTTMVDDDDDAKKAAELKTLLSSKTSTTTIKPSNESSTSNPKSTTQNSDYQNFDDHDDWDGFDWSMDNQNQTDPLTRGVALSNDSIITVSMTTQETSSTESTEAPTEISLFPWESAECEDRLDNCGDFKPFCSILEIQAYRMCRKTCNVCYLDKPQPKSSKFS